MKKILSLLAISFSLAFAYTAADVYGAWTETGDLGFYGSLLSFDKSGLNNGEWRFNNGRITFSNSNMYCILVSAKMMDCQSGSGKKTYKKAGTIAQLEQTREKFGQEIEKRMAERDSLEKWSKQTFYISQERAKAILKQTYDFYKNVAKGEFESTADFNKRKAELDKNLKDSSVSYFNSTLNSIVEVIENDDIFKFDLVKYDADKQVFEVVFERDGFKANGKAKIPPEIAKSLRENKEQFSFRYENADLRSINYTLIPIKMSIYGKNGERYEVDFDIPKTAKEIVFKGAELWKDNPYAKSLSVSLAEAIKRYAPIKEAAIQAAEAARKAAEEAADEQIKKEEEIVKNGLIDPRDNKKYKLVKIGNQIWMAENLNYNASGSVCYENQESNCNKYGKLYDYKTAMEVCPSGWHLPSDEEWEELIKYAGGEQMIKKLKAKNSWNGGNGTDDYGFSALPGGGTNFRGGFDGLSERGSWWGISRYFNLLTIEKDNMRFNAGGRTSASVRCLYGKPSNKKTEIGPG